MADKTTKALKTVTKPLPNRRDGTNGGGKPAYYTSPESMQVKIDAYFAECKTGFTEEVTTKKGEVREVKRHKPASMVGLALFLGFSSEKGLYRYEQANKGYGQTVSCARSRIKEDALEGGLTGQYEPKVSGLHLISLGYHKDAKADDYLGAYSTLSDQQIHERLERHMRRMNVGNSIDVD